MKGPDRVIACLTALTGRRCDPSAGQGHPCERR